MQWEYEGKQKGFSRKPMSEDFYFERANVKLMVGLSLYLL